MGFDRLGRPIVATQYGNLRLWEMTKLTTVERMTELHAREQELLLRVLRRRTLEGGGGGGGGGGEGARREGRGGGESGDDDGGDRHIVDTAVVVIDTAGLTLRHVSTAVGRPSLRRCSRPARPVSATTLSYAAVLSALSKGEGRTSISVWVPFERSGVEGGNGRSCGLSVLFTFSESLPPSWTTASWQEKACRVGFTCRTVVLLFVLGRIARHFEV